MLKDSTYKAYSGLAKYCRTGNLDDAKKLDVRQDRIHHYRRLVFNITNGTLKQAYPITYKLLTENQWLELVNDFFQNHDAQEYRVWMMPKEFYLFAQEKNYADKFNIPFLDDLLLFEWIEIEVHTMPDEEFPVFNNEGNYWTDQLILNPEYRLLQLAFPVHTKKTLEISEKDRGNYFLLAYREIENKGVQFMNLSVLYAYILEQIEEGLSLNEIIKTFCELTNTDILNVDTNEIEGFIQKLVNKNVVFGFKKVEANY